MDYLKLIVLALILQIFAITLYAQAPDVPLQDKPINELVEYWSDYYDIDGERLFKVIKCESNFKTSAVHYHDGGKGKHSVGLLQFQESTFKSWSAVMGQELDYYSYFDQIKLASFMWSKGQQNQWTCYRLTQ